MSKFSELDIERQETGKRIKDLLPDGKKTGVILRIPNEVYTYGAKKTKPKQHPSETYAIYWQLCFDVIVAAGELAGKDKLIMNFRDPQKRHSVKDVVNQSFDGEKGNIADKRNDNARIFFTNVDNLNEYAVEHGFDQVCGMKLMGMLVDANVRDKFKHHIKKHLESNHPPFALDELPGKDFRKTKTTRA